MAMNGETLEYNDIFQENRGAMHEGRLQLLNEKVIFKNNKTGKIDTVMHDDVEDAIWRRVAKGHELKLVSKDGHQYRFDGFQEQEFERLAEFLRDRYDVDLKQQDLSGRGWNWGKTQFKGYQMLFDVGEKLSFEIPLTNVSQCTQNKDEVALEFHQNDDSELSLMEMRFYIPPSQDEYIDRVQEFHANVMDKADVLQAKGNAICIFTDMKFLTPRGHYDVRMYPKFVQLHGKTYDYKITYTSILRLFLLPHKDQRQIFLVVSLDPPLKQGQTRYHFLILLFYKETDLSIELALSEEEIQEKFAGKLQKEVSGPAYEVVSRVMKHLVQRKITVPGSFKGVGGAQCLTCSFKASSGLLFPLERGFMYIFKPPVHVRFDEIASVNFARGAMKVNKSFDFEIETRNKTSYVFSNIERDQYTALYDFVSKKKLKIKNIGKGGYVDTMRGSDDEDSDDNNVHDPYMMRMKAEAADRDENGDDDDSESDDEDFQPEDNGEEVAEEFDSNASSSDSDEDGEQKTKKPKRRGSDDDDDDDAGDEEDSEEEERPKKKDKRPKERKPRKQKEGGRKRTKKTKDPNAPKRPMSAYMAWLNDNRNQIKEENPGIGVTEVSKIAGQMWKKVSSEDKERYEKNYRKEMEVYHEKMKDYTPPESSSESSRPPTKKSKQTKQSSPRIPKQSPSKFKSKETISQSDDASSSSDDERPGKADSSSDEEASKSSKGRKKGGDESDVEVKDEEEMGTESEAEDTPASSEEDSD